MCGLQSTKLIFVGYSQLNSTIVYIHTYIRMYVRTYVRTYVCVCVYVRACVCACVCARSYTKITMNYCDSLTRDHRFALSGGS